MKTHTLLRGSHLYALDGIRGIAILMVLFFHCASNLNIFNTGWLGVDLFFVLSGFLITGILIESLQDKDYFTAFYRKRMLRILPLYIFIVGVFFLYIYKFTTGSNFAAFSHYTENKLSFVLFMQNWVYNDVDLFLRPQLAHLWSLAVEEQFYFIWPLIIYMCKDIKKITVVSIILIVISFASKYWVHFAHLGSEKAFVSNNTFCRMDSLILGGLAYIATTLHLSSFIRSLLKYLFVSIAVMLAIAELQYGVLHKTSAFMAFGGFTLVAVLFAIALYFVVTSNTKKWYHTILQHKFLMFSGKISYGLYLFHWPLQLQFCSKIHSAFLTIIPETAANIFTSATIIGISYVISYISYEYFEKVFLQFKAGFNVSEIKLPIFGRLKLTR
jgi:peptidoglycan/LPS O-acetylase OafA/YrhL